jgi:hypothetical protein
MTQTSNRTKAWEVEKQQKIGRQIPDQRRKEGKDGQARSAFDWESQKKGREWKSSPEGRSERRKEKESDIREGS